MIKKLNKLQERLGEKDTIGGYFLSGALDGLVIGSLIVTTEVILLGCMSYQFIK